MKRAVRPIILALLVLFAACTKRQVTAAGDSYQLVAHGLCLSFVMDKMKKASEPDSVLKDAVVLSKDSDARFRAKYHETSKAITDAKSPREKERLDKQQMSVLLDTLRQESPDLIKKCDKLAEGFRRCDKSSSDKRGCLEKENKEPMEDILAFLNRDAQAGFPSVR